MMAAEATQSNPVDAAKTSTEPAITISPDSQDADAKHPLLNGAAASDEIENKHLSEIVDHLVNSAEVSVSGGSDTEAARDDSSKDGGKGHARTSSTVKKPTSFKSVSVNKTFLSNKSQGSGTVTPKSLEKATSSPAASGLQAGGAVQAAVRPRLVAKLGSASRDGTKTLGASGAKAAGAPDPSTVWTKNRPPPPVEPKKLTDEELKKYGIHMTARLAPEDSNGANNWADVDDDDDDWIPSEIQWNDGTKVTIPAVDEVATQPPPPPPPQPAPAPAPAVTAAKELKPIEKPKSPAPPSSSGKAILSSGKGLVLKGAPEKPTLVARPPPPPAPIKSPWAHIEKASPVPLDNSGPQVPTRTTPRESQFTKGYTPPPAKEIAADDFSRSSGPVNPNLYNSQSGRYEPVTDRRVPGRNEPYQRHPAALLQRSSHPDGPPGPSPAFQSNRIEQDAPYGRRRGSSNVSGGSGSFFQRPSKPHDHAMPPPELLQIRRGSLASDSPISPSGPRPGHGQAWQPRTSPYVAHAAPYPNSAMHERQNVPPMAQAPPQGPTEDDYELQKKLMAEKLQAARQRKAEEEAKAEAEKQKRIAAKLAALGPAPERKSAKQAAAKETASQSASPNVASSSADVTSQKQALPTKAPSTNSDAETSRISADGGADSTRATSRRSRDESGSGGGSQTEATQDSGAAAAAAAAPAWQGSASAQTSRFSWGPSGVQPVAQNVWGAPNNNRTLGNGTFSADLGRISEGYPPNLAPMAVGSGPGPIGPPSGPKGSQQPQVLKPIGPPSTAPVAPRGGSTADDDARSRWAIASRTAEDRMRNEARERVSPQQPDVDTRATSGEDVRPAYHDSWKPVKLDSEGRRVETKERVHVVHGGAVWNPTGANADERKPKAAAPPQGPASAGPAAPVGASPQTRASRFFPVKSDGSRTDDASRHRSPSPPPPDMDGHPAFDGDATHPHVALPPSRPVVRLPPSMGRQPAPPTATTTTAAANNGGSFSWASPRPFQESQPRGGSAAAAPRSVPSSWQSKINNLLHDGKSAAQQGRTTVDPASRRAMDSASAQGQATVSLPGHVDGGGTAEDSLPTSKVMAEECFEEQEMGSLPPVRLPAVVPDAAWNPAPAQARSIPKRMMITATSAEVLEESPQSFAFVFLNGMTNRKRVHLSMARSYSTSSRSGNSSSNNNNNGNSSSRGPRSSGTRQHHGRGSGGGSSSAPRGRESSAPLSGDGGSTQQSPGSSHGSAPSAPSGRGRGSFRRGADWSSRRTSTPLQT